MKKYAKAILLIITMFSFKLSVSSLVGLCKYDDDLDTPVNKAATIDTDGHSIYIMLEDTRRYIMIDNHEYANAKVRENIFDHYTSFTNFLNPLSGIAGAKNIADIYFGPKEYTNFYFRYSYDNVFASDYVGGKVLGNARVVYLNGENYNVNYDPTRSGDTKFRFVEKGSCPSYVCYCHGTGTTKDTAFIFYPYAEDGDTAFKEKVDSQCASTQKVVVERNFIGIPQITGVDAMTCDLKKLRFDLIKYVDFLGINPTTGLTINSVLASAKVNPAGLTTSQINQLKDFYSYKNIDGKYLPVGQATEAEMHYVTKFLVSRNDDIRAAAESIVNNPDVFANSKDNALRDNYSELRLLCSSFIENYRRGGSASLNLNESSYSNCDAIFGDPNVSGSFARYLNNVLHLVQYLGPMLVIVLTMFEYFKVIIGKEDDALKSANSKTMKRVILLLILYYLPTLIIFLLETFGFEGSCSFNNWV